MDREETQKEQIINIISHRDFVVAITNKGNVFKRYGLDDIPESFWEPVDLPDFSIEMSVRQTEPLEDRRNRLYGR